MLRGAFEIVGRGDLQVGLVARHDCHIEPCAPGNLNVVGGGRQNQALGAPLGSVAGGFDLTADSGQAVLGGQGGVTMFEIQLSQ